MPVGHTRARLVSARWSPIPIRGWLLGLSLALEAQGRLEEARMAYRIALERGQFKPEAPRFLRERGGGQCREILACPCFSLDLLLFGNIFFLQQKKFIR
jgi:hypothetical protein